MLFKSVFNINREKIPHCFDAQMTKIEFLREADQNENGKKINLKRKILGLIQTDSKLANKYWYLLRSPKQSMSTD